MGVPAFYRWLSEKYPKIVEDILEERVHVAGGSSNLPLPFDATRPNPSGLECDNLYVDMNGIIHPCSHPEHGPQPTCEEEMYENVCAYVDRLFRAMRPRRLLYLAVDGVAPRAKMNQQRARRFRSAQEAREIKELEEHVRQELIKVGEPTPPVKDAWDSNVITPGTPFMLNLSEYIRFYIRKRISQDKAWRRVQVIFSDASIPGEGEHKIMDHVRRQRSQPGYNPNLVHVLHGLDADLIMLALATHEVRFYISREEVLFGRKSREQQEQRQLESGFQDAQRALDEDAGAAAMELDCNQGKPLQRINIATLREYLANEFATCLDPQKLPFPPSLERLIDDIVFLCFFVGNDFLPHLPSLDIRDGALDYLFNIYKRLLPGLGDYITKSGGNVNLSHVDVIFAEVGSIEDYVFSMKHENEKREQQRRQQMLDQKKRRNRNNNDDAPPTVMKAPERIRMGRAAKILEANDPQAEVALQRGHSAKEQHRQSMKASHDGGSGSTSTARSGGAPHRANTIQVSHMMTEDNLRAAQALKDRLAGAKPELHEKDPRRRQQQQQQRQQQDADETKTKQDPAKMKEEEEGEEEEGVCDDADADAAAGGGGNAPKPTRMGEEEGVDDGDDAPMKTERDENEGEDSDGDEDEDDKAKNKKKRKRDARVSKDGVGVVGDAEEEFDADDGDDDDDDDDEDLFAVEEDAVKIEDVVKVAEADEEQVKAFKERISREQQKKLDDYARNVQDNVRLHETGWKDRYYSDKCKADDVENHGGREHLFRSYVVGLCWVMKYYYDGCPSWKWYYPFHYAPFASDLKNIERFASDCRSLEIHSPFNPVEQLMAVLPSDSAHAIPKPSRWLMLDEESPIIDFYPKDVPVDPNGKAMPWLWVVLLPFIDEDRLLAAMSPTMAKWTKEELFCNARGLDDGYLYVHRSHPICLKLTAVLGPGKTAKAPKTRIAGTYNGAGFSGMVRPPLSNEIFPVDEENPTPIPPPATSTRIDASKFDSIFADSIHANDALCVSFSEPSKLSHKSVLLPGAKVPKAKLTAEDKVIRRPRLNRGGGTIANMGMGAQGQSYQSGYGSMNISSYERELAQKTGRGHQMYQAGTRTWGSLEPTPKRHRQQQQQQQQQHQQHGPPQHVTANPFMGGGPQYAMGRGRGGGPQAPWQQQQQGPYQQQQGAYQQQGYGTGRGQQLQGPPHQYQQRQQQHGGYAQQVQPQQWSAQGGYQQQQQRPPAYHQQSRPNQPPQYQNRPQQQRPPPYQQHSQHQPPPPPPPPPPVQQQGFNFRSFNNPQQQSNRPGGDPRAGQQQQQRGRASADVMSSLKAQLASTLRQNRRHQG